MSMSFKASPDGTYGEILVNGQVVAKLPVSGNAVIPNLVGTVSESGGVPTGAVVERGSNANGDYVRFADGTQICYWPVSFGGIGAGFRSMSWTFPATFTDPPAVSGDVTAFASVVRYVGNATASSGTGGGDTVSVESLEAGNGTLNAYVTAIGRWF